MPDIELRKRLLIVEEIFHEGGPVAKIPLKRVAAISVIKNPFAGRKQMEPSKLLVVFMNVAPNKQARDKLLAMPCDPEELHIHGREVYIYYPEGMARPKIPLIRLEKALQCSSTGRNWNTVNKLLAMAEALET